MIVQELVRGTGVSGVGVTIVAILFAACVFGLLYLPIIVSEEKEKKMDEYRRRDEQRRDA